MPSRRSKPADAAPPPPAPDSDDEAPEEMAVTRPEGTVEKRRKAASAAELGRAVRDKRVEAIKAGLRDAAAPGRAAQRGDELPTALLEAVAGVDMHAKPADQSAEDAREARMATARRARAAERRAHAARLDASRASERARARSDPTRLHKTEGHLRLATLLDEPAGATRAHAAPNRAALDFLKTHVYGSRLARTPAAQAQGEALAAKRRRQLIAERGLAGANGVSKRHRKRAGARRAV